MNTYEFWASCVWKFLINDIYVYNMDLYTIEREHNNNSTKTMQKCTKIATIYFSIFYLQIQLQNIYHIWLAYKISVQHNWISMTIWVFRKSCAPCPNINHIKNHKEKLDDFGGGKLKDIIINIYPLCSI